MKELVRIAQTDIKGQRPIYMGLSKIKGVSNSFAHAICVITNTAKSTKVGLLTEEQIKIIEAALKNPEKVPAFLRNRRKDLDSGEDKHLTGVDLKLQNEFDIRRLKKTKSYKGMRHAWGLPVRGQRTRGNFRRGRAVGVVKKAVKQQSKTKPKASSGGKKK